MKAWLGLYGIADRGRFPTPRWTHDHGLALVADGRVLWTLELERVTGVKHDNRLPDLLEQLVGDGVVELPDDFRVVCVDSLVGRAFVSRTGRWRIEGDAVDLAAAPPLQRGRASIGTREIEAWHCCHELAHVGACLPFAGGFEDGTLLVHIDGGASQSNASAHIWKDGRLRHVAHGWETLWPVLNFGYNDLTHGILGLDEDHRMVAPGRLMGLAGHAQARPGLREWLREHEWFRGHWQHPGRFFEAARQTWGWDGEALVTTDPLLQEIAAACQEELEDAVLGLLSSLRERTGARRLCLSGGAALNVRTNDRIVRSGLFDDVFVPPCCNDGGLALGAAALAAYLESGPLERHGPFLNRVGLRPLSGWGRPVDVAELARRLAAGQVVATCTGPAETGPRALGHRSLLAAPTSAALGRHVSETLKRREWYRPVAPMVLDMLAEELFPGATSTRLSETMLTNVPVAPAWRERIPAVVHVDGTARVQVVREGDPELGLVAAVLRRCWEEHGVPCLVNTSFNGPGQPIVHSPDDAVRTARDLGVEALVVDDRMEAWVPMDWRRDP